MSKFLLMISPRKIRKEEKVFCSVQSRAHYCACFLKLVDLRHFVNVRVWNIFGTSNFSVVEERPEIILSNVIEWHALQELFKLAALHLSFQISVVTVRYNSNSSLPVRSNPVVLAAVLRWRGVFDKISIWGFEAILCDVHARFMALLPARSPPDHRVIGAC